MTLARARNGRLRRRGDGLRRCVGCGLARAPGDMVRFHATSNGRLAVDVRHVGGGRGTYVCCDRGCFEAAFKKQRLARALRIPVRATSQPEILLEVIRDLGACAEHEFLRAWRQGAVTIRPSAIDAALAAGRVRMLLIDEPPAGHRHGDRVGDEGAGPVPRFPLEPVKEVLQKLTSHRLVPRVAIHKRKSTGRLEQVFRHLQAMGRFE